MNHSKPIASAMYPKAIVIKKAPRIVVGRPYDNQTPFAALFNSIYDAAIITDDEGWVMDVNAQAVNQNMQQFGVSVLIHGHTHRPAIHRLKHGLRAVLGDWENGAVLLSVQSTGLSLERVHAHGTQQLAYEPWPEEA